MIKYWKQEEKGLTEIDAFEKGCWMDIETPSKEETEFLINEFRVPEEFIQDILDIDERSRTEIEGRWLLIVMRIPVYISKHTVPFYTVPMGVLISTHCIITICMYESEVTNPKVLSKFKSFNITNRHNFVLYLLLRSSTLYLNYLKVITRQTNNIEKEIQKSTKNSELQALIRIEKSLVYYQTSLKSNEMLLAKLQRLKLAQSEQIDEDLLEDVIVENKQASEMAKIHSDILAGLMDAFASVISNNLNVVMKQLTVVTIILMIPTLVSSIFGMNIPNGMEKNNYAIWIVMGISFGIALAGGFIFRKRNIF